MVNETFSAQRFSKYFKYDLQQLWNNNGKAAVILGFISVISYILWITCSLVFSGSWQGPGVIARLVFFYVGFLALILYQTRTYGYLTEKKAGQAWLMLPASTLEKFVSMMIITVILIPLAYTISYMALDSLIGLLDPTTGGPILAGYSTVMEKVNEGLSAASEEGFHFNLAAFAVPFVLQSLSNILYFLLCGLCFKKWKILGGFGVLIGIEMLIVPLFSHLVFKFWTPALANYDFGDDPVLLTETLNKAVSYGNVFNAVLVVGLAIAIYYRLKTLKH